MTKLWLWGTIIPVGLIVYGIIVSILTGWLERSPCIFSLKEDEKNDRCGYYRCEWHSGVSQIVAILWPIGIPVTTVIFVLYYLVRGIVTDIFHPLYMWSSGKNKE